MSQVDKFHCHKVDGIDGLVAYPTSVVDCPQCSDRAAATCRLCQLAVETRQENIAILRDRIAMNEAEIAEIRRGERHTAYHQQYMA